jgi:hypothetical protein
MSRSGYSDDIDNWALIKWRGRVASATRGKRGQKLLRDLLAALDAMPDKRLIAHELVTEDGEHCALGILGAQRGIDLSLLDPEEYDAVASVFDVASPLVQEIVYMNDEHIQDDKWVEEEIVGPVRPHYPDYGRHRRGHSEPDETAPARRWQLMRDWVASQIADAASAASK